MSAPTMLDPVVAYAAAVRSHLADLGPEVLDDLTGGLEADLAESVADALDGAAPTDADLVGRFGPAQAYAAELRESAGLPPAGSARRRTSVVDAVSGWWHGRLERVSRRLEATSWWPPTRDFLLTLTPLWWVLRGWGLAAVVSFPLMFLANDANLRVVPPLNPFTWAYTLACVVVSVQFGRGVWVPRGRWSVMWRVLRVVLVPVTFGIAVTTMDNLASDTRDDLYYSHQSAVQEQLAQIPAWNAFGYHDTGAMVDGKRTTNLFVYGPDGKLIDGAQIVDQAGRPLVLGMGEWHTVSPDNSAIYVPRLDESGRAVDNAFPIPLWTTGDIYESTDDEGQPVLPDGAQAPTPRPPALSLLPLQSRPGEGATTPDDATSEGAAPGDADDETSSDAPADKPSDKVSDAPSNKASEKPSGKPSDKGTKSSD
ncbi:hypothetical protein [Sanguibacter sp. HDW7]|uniref:hypothetical protein n=1 Tax=Sanguibacter sp. HDW7 TaxID=2714931 RepID=UPI001407A016|nr:hypothetical protein [Sanguibacter sp. HDW7]QIK84522.1 hypothetical protein G7063_13550 [Sanguibacter sp. HDW7]